MKRAVLLLPLLLVGCGSPSPRPALQAMTSRYGVQLAWAEDDKSAVSFNVYRLDGSGAPVKINDAAVNAPWYVDDTVKNGLTYTYDVTAVDGSGAESDPSNQVTVQVP